MELINQNKWEQVWKQIERKKLDPGAALENGYTPLHMAVLRRQTKLIDRIGRLKPEAFEVGDRDGQTPLHLAAQLVDPELFEQILVIHPGAMKQYNNRHQTPLALLIDQPKLLESVYRRLPKLGLKLKHLDQPDHRRRTNIHRLILESGSPEYLKLLRLALETGGSSSAPESNPPLIFAVQKRRFDAVPLLLKYGADPNQMNPQMETAFHHAAYHGHRQTIERLVAAGADVNYLGAEGKNNPMSYLIAQGNFDTVDYLLEHGYDPNNRSATLNTDLHRLLRAKNPPAATVFRMLYHGDLNLENLNGETPLALLLKHHNWKNYTEVLKTKPLEIYGRRSPLKSLETPGEFTDFVVESQLKLAGCEGGGKGCRCDSTTEKCRRLMKGVMKKKNSSLLNREEQKTVSRKVKLIEAKPQAHGRFNADYLNNLIYIYSLLQKHPSLSLPYQHYDESIAATDANDRVFNTVRDVPGQIIGDILDVYDSVFYELNPSIILWHNRHLHYVHPRFKLALLKPLTDRKCRFIYVKLTLIINASSVHANGVLIDKKQKIIERFEPYGLLPVPDATELDRFLNETISEITRPHLGDTRYLAPGDHRQPIGFQTASGDGYEAMKKLGDPGGYCLAWTFWYVEMRLTHPDVDPTQLIVRSMDEISRRAKKGDEIKIFIDYIRNYSYRLDAMKNRFLKSAGLKKSDYYTLIFTAEKQMKIAKRLAEQFEKLIR